MAVNIIHAAVIVGAIFRNLVSNNRSEHAGQALLRSLVHNSTFYQNSYDPSKGKIVEILHDPANGPWEREFEGRFKDRDPHKPTVGRYSVIKPNSNGKEIRDICRTEVKDGNGLIIYQTDFENIHQIYQHDLCSHFNEFEGITGHATQTCLESVAEGNIENGKRQWVWIETNKHMKKFSIYENGESKIIITETMGTFSIVFKSNHLEFKKANGLSLKMEKNNKLILSQINKSLVTITKLDTSSSNTFEIIDQKNNRQYLV